MSEAVESPRNTVKLEEAKEKVESFAKPFLRKGQYGRVAVYLDISDGVIMQVGRECQVAEKR